MKLILIDVIKEDVREVETNGELKDLYTLIGCRCVDKRSFDNFDIIVDDEGLYHSKKFFCFDGEHLFAGNGLIAGIGKNFKWGTSPLGVEEVKSRVEFLDKQGAYLKAQELDI